MKIYVDYNILGRLDEKFQNELKKSSIPHWKLDYESLPSIWKAHNEGKIDLITCEDDCYMEFLDYKPEKIKNYNKIEEYFHSIKHEHPEMSRKFDLFKELKKGELLICPFGEYGFGSGPYGGGQKENYDLLNQLRIMLNRENKTPHDDRDARHLMHCILYRCDYFLTMDYKTIVDRFSSRYELIEPYLIKKGYKLEVANPSKLLKILRKEASRYPIRRCSRDRSRSVKESFSDKM